MPVRDVQFDRAQMMSSCPRSINNGQVHSSTIGCSVVPTTCCHGPQTHHLAID